MKFPRLRFGLRTLAAFTLMSAGVYGLWYRWQPWVLVETRMANTYPIWYGTMAPEGQEVLIADKQGKAHLWNIVSGNDRLILNGHHAPICAAAFSKDGKRIATASEDWEVRIWDSGSGKQMGLIDKVGNWVRTLDFSPDGMRLLLADTGDTVHIWSVQTCESMAAFTPIKQYGFDEAAYSPDGACLFALGKFTYLCDGDFKVQQAIPINRPVMFSPDGRWLAGVNSNGVLVVDVKSHGQRQFKSTAYYFAAFAFSPDSKRLAAGERGRVDIWDVESGRELSVLNRAAKDCAFFPTGERLVTVSPKSPACIWNTENGQLLDQIPCYGSRVVGFTKTGDRMAIGADDSISVWSKRRPEYWWGVAWLPEFWLVLISGIVLLWSVWRDRRDLRKKAAEATA